MAVKFSEWADDRGAAGGPEEPGTWEDGLAELAAGKGQPAVAAPAPWDRDLREAAAAEPAAAAVEPWEESLAGGGAGASPAGPEGGGGRGGGAEQEWEAWAQKLRKAGEAAGAAGAPPGGGSGEGGDGPDGAAGGRLVLDSFGAAVPHFPEWEGEPNLPVRRDHAADWAPEAGGGAAAKPRQR